MPPRARRSIWSRSAGTRFARVRDARLLREERGQVGVVLQRVEAHPRQRGSGRRRTSAYHGWWKCQRKKTRRGGAVTDARFTVRRAAGHKCAGRLLESAPPGPRMSSGPARRSPPNRVRSGRKQHSGGRPGRRGSPGLIGGLGGLLFEYSRRVSDAAYVPLARKWRPRTFADVVGQEEIVRALTNAVTARPARARLPLLGAARRRQDDDGAPPRRRHQLQLVRPARRATPCGTCASCVEVLEGRSHRHPRDRRRHARQGGPGARPHRGRGLRAVARPPEGLHHRRGPRDLVGRVPGAPEDARGAAVARRLHPRDDRAAQDPRDDPLALPALRLPAPHGRRGGRPPRRHRAARGVRGRRRGAGGEGQEARRRARRPRPRSPRRPRAASATASRSSTRRPRAPAAASPRPTSRRSSARRTARRSSRCSARSWPRRPDRRSSRAAPSWRPRAPTRAPRSTT